MKKYNDRKYTIKIPEFYLVHIAACGNMSNGKLMNIMKIWAQKECKKLKLDNEVKKAQENNLKQLRERMKNILGKDKIKKIDIVLNDMINKLKK